MAGSKEGNYLRCCFIDIFIHRERSLVLRKMVIYLSAERRLRLPKFDRDSRWRENISSCEKIKQVRGDRVKESKQVTMESERIHDEEEV